MSRRADIAWSRQLAGTSAGHLVLWTIAAMLALVAHAGAGWWVMREQPAPLSDDGGPTAIMIELAPVEMAPSATEEEQVAPDAVESVAAEAPPPPERVEPAETVDTAMVAEPVPIEAEADPEAEPAEPVEIQQAADAEPAEAAETAPAEAASEADAADMAEPAEIDEVAEVEPERLEPVEEPMDPLEEMITAELDRVEIPLPTARPDPPPPPRAQPPRQREQARPAQQRQPAPARQRQAAPAREARRAQTQAQNAPQAAAPQTSRSASASVSPARWQSRLLAHLERRKRYPAEARRQRQEGTAQVRFTIDAGGNVQSVTLVRSSGVPALDQEVVAMVRRASPVPAPPPGVSRTIVVPVRFNLR